jgi:Sec-independent protein secretion pathway component TatC
MHTIKSIFVTKTLYGHLLIRLVLFCVGAGVAYIFVIPLIFWSILGEGAGGDRIAEEPLNAFLFQYGALIIALLIIAILTGLNIKKTDFSKAKSYIIVGIVLIMLYLFKEAILDAIFYGS